MAYKGFDALRCQMMVKWVGIHPWPQQCVAALNVAVQRTNLSKGGANWCFDCRSCGLRLITLSMSCVHIISQSHLSWPRHAIP